MDYGKILSRAWHIVWNNKFLVLLGFLAALGGGSGGGRGTGNASNWPTYQFDRFDRFPERAADFIQSNLVLLGGLGLLVIIVGIVFWLLRLTSEAGLIEAADALDDGKEMTFGRSFSAGSRHLGRLIGLNLTLYGPVILASLIFGIVGLFGAVSAVNSRGTGPMEFLAILGICLVPLICVLAVYGIVAAVIYPFAQRGVVLGHHGVMDGIRHGWRVLVDNLVDIIVLALIFLVLNFVVGGIVALVALPIGAASLLPAILKLIQNATVGAGSIVLAVMGVVLIGLIAAIVNSIVRAYQSTAFTLAYKQFVGGEAPAADADLTEAPSG